MSEYVSILFLFAFAVILCGTFIILSALLGRPKKKTTSLLPYECGVNQAMEPRRPLSIKFFIVAIVFLLFDVEVALLYPWAILFRKFTSEGMGRLIFIEGLAFIAVLALGLIYIYRTGVLEWED